MIAKPLELIEWADLLALKESAREEGPQIEYKASFKGGIAFEELNDNQRANAIDALAREVIAFLNSTGGDVVVGAQERSNEEPIIEAFTLIPNANAVADRLSQSLSALIEPAQSLIHVRAICPDEQSSGVLVIRANSSVRAPHRSRRSKEAFTRRGRETSPMSMDEIQDLTIRRASNRASKEAELLRRLREIEQNRLFRENLPSNRIHFRLSFMPFTDLALSLNDDLLTKFLGRVPRLSDGTTQVENDVFLRELFGQWRPILRGRRVFQNVTNSDNAEYLSKEIYENGVMISDFAMRTDIRKAENFALSMHNEWFLGYLANSIESMKRVVEAAAQESYGLLGFSCRFDGEAYLVLGRGFFSDSVSFLPGVHAVPPFEVLQSSDFETAFKQLQIDLCAVAGHELKAPFAIVDE